MKGALVRGLRLLVRRHRRRTEAVTAADSTHPSWFWADGRLLL